MYGYMGRILRVDLTNGTFQDEVLKEDDAINYLGGSGIGTRILYDETAPETEPLSPENILIFMTGPFTGTGTPLSGRHAVVSKSPLTNIFAQSDIGGSFGTALKATGYDGIVFKGKASSPKYLYITDHSAELRDADIVWGKNSYETEIILKQNTDPKAEVTCIGPAGEKLVKFASIMSDGKDGRAAGRAGLGAVMGSKNLKAIVAIGSKKTPIAEPERLKELIKDFAPKCKEAMQGMTDFGTTVSHVATEESGDMPIKNWMEGSWHEGAEKTCGQAMVERGILVNNYRCKSCFVGCGRVVKITEGKYAPVDGGGPEYESMAMLGANCMVDDLEAICKANELCNQYGMDTISTGSAVAQAMELFEKGLITPEDTEGLSLEWGSGDVLVELIDKIGEREGIGNLLAEGVVKVAERFGPEASKSAIAVKGLDLPAHDPRAFFALGIQYATSNRGGCHLSTYADVLEKGVTYARMGFPEVMDRFDENDKGRLSAKMQDFCALFDSLKLCKFLMWGGVQEGDIEGWYQAVTGRKISFEELMITGERIVNLQRMYNYRLGLTRKDDILPDRILKDPRGSGGAPTQLPPLEKMLEEFYRVRGWDSDGIPTQEKLKEIGLDLAV
ncbi:aldehyde ferredoxin oxidoreductase family protein [Sinanaerobacter chloroacetimidivorans]|uniref:Aldehyde ferredoxin oxidoreductase family protein n=1 Tax=Sinanaerobacter chloroacetimidivorans TaxID=2818044 RepID=A0A8J7W013_9FIRM|nr:aldehyde ferredoxin oxidoreductase family protein [Sinanaerobacter chloroacetimidivorans]MBR0597859.1 aldehyde ferredoxin oxidoreductase family protein [Sinanaerobacter chloroacetimidivorans]